MSQLSQSVTIIIPYNILYKYGIAGMDWFFRVFHSLLALLRMAWALLEGLTGGDGLQAAVTARRLQLAQLRSQRKNISLHYDPFRCGSLERFKTCKDTSPCLFAREAKLWGSSEFDRQSTLEQNILLIMPALLKYVTIVDEGANIDGFLIELRGAQYCRDLKSFSAAVREVLGTVSRCDPSGLDCIRMASIVSPAWHFSFCTVPIFVTVFAPLYGPHSSRYMGPLTDDNKDSCFILMQPEESFHRHKIGKDRAETCWDKPRSIRDKIRASFRHHSRDYFIPLTTSYAVAMHYLPHPENNSSTELHCPLIHFWRKEDSVNDLDDGCTTANKE